MSEMNNIDLVILEETDLSGNIEPRITNTTNTTNSFIEPLEFSVGQFYPRSENYVHKRKFTREEELTHPKKRARYTKNRKNSKANTIDRRHPPVDPRVRIRDLCDLFEDANPYYVNTRVNHIVIVKSKLPINLDPKANAGHIKIIIPKNSETIQKSFAHHVLSSNTGYLFDWMVVLGELDKAGPLFSFKIITPTKFNFKFKNIILKEDIYYEAEEIFQNNQWLRWQFKRLVNRWLANKSKKRSIGEDCDIITCEAIPLEDQARIVSIKNRTEYVFSGHVLLKTAKSCLEGQHGAIPHVKAPHNPYTNTPFTYGEMIKLHSEILKWCGAKGKSVPGVISLYREYKFKHSLLLRINNNYLQLKATLNYILNDDTTGEFFIENLEILLEDYSTLLTIDFDPTIISYQRFRLWNSLEPKNDLLICWKRLVADFWYYKQTEQFPREHWRTESSIFLDIVILIKASEHKLHNIVRNYYNRLRHVEL